LQDRVQQVRLHRDYWVREGSADVEVAGEGCRRAGRVALGLLHLCLQQGRLGRGLWIAGSGEHGAGRLGVAGGDQQPGLAEANPLGQEPRRLPAAPQGGGHPPVERGQPGGGLALAGQQPASQQGNRRDGGWLGRGQRCPVQVPAGGRQVRVVVGRPGQGQVGSKRGEWPAEALT